MSRSLGVLSGQNKEQRTKNNHRRICSWFSYLSSQNKEQRTKNMPSVEVGVFFVLYSLFFVLCSLFSNLAGEPQALVRVRRKAQPQHHRRRLPDDPLRHLGLAGNAIGKDDRKLMQLEAGL